MNYLELYQECSAALKTAEIENYRNEARWLVLEPFQLSAGDLYSAAPVPPEQIDRVRQLCARRCQHEPLQYLLGSAPFGELELAVTPAVLIPRCETVVLAEFVLQHLASGASLLDVGCGSGAIALLAASRRPDIRVTAVDKSPEALRVAELNARSLDLAAVPEFLESDLLSALVHRRFDVIVANLPYVTFDEYAELAPDVREYEPQMALTADDNGMALISRLIADSPEHLKPGGLLALEMSPHQTGRAADEMSRCGFENISVFADQFGKKRFVAGVL